MTYLHILRPIVETKLSRTGSQHTSPSEAQLTRSLDTPISKPLPQNPWRP